MNKELMDALNVLEKEKNISKDTLLGAIEQSLIQACKNHFGKADNVHVMINPETCDFSVYAEREVKEFVEDPALEISLTDAQKINANAELGDVIKVQIQSKEFGRIATQNAKNVILQKIMRKSAKFFTISTTEWRKKSLQVSYSVSWAKMSASILARQMRSSLRMSRSGEKNSIRQNISRYTSWKLRILQKDRVSRYPEHIRVS